MVIATVLATDNFERDIRKLRDRKLKERVKVEIRRLTENPELGKPLRYGFKGERTIRISPYRLIYAVSGDALLLLRFEHRADVYD